MNADPRVMEHFPALMTRGESDALVDRIEEGFEENGFGLWAVEVAEGAGSGSFAGFVGLARCPDQMPFSPAVEVGWRLAAEFWGRGFATEAGRASLGFGFEELGLDEIVSFTFTGNAPSRAVMERLGMHHDPAEDFEHPLVAEGHRIRPHVLYRLQAA